MKQDFHLVGLIKDLWKERCRSSNLSFKLQTKRREKNITNPIFRRIDQLYKAALKSHGLENYRHSIKDSIHLAIDACDSPKLNFLCRNISATTGAEAIYHALFKDANLSLAETLLVGHENLRIKALKKAARLGNLSYVDRKEALILAVRQGRLSVVQALLENHKHLKPFAMSATVSSRQIDVIEALIDTVVTLSPNQRVLAIDIAADSARITTILTLLENHDYLRHSARNALIRYGHFLLLHSLRYPRQLVFDKTFTLSFDDVRSDPKQYLDMVINKRFPREILLLDSLGAPIKTIDCGGVGKGFVTLLFESLTPLLHLSSSLFPVLEENLADNENAKALFRKIGYFFSELQQANKIATDPFLIVE